MTTIRDMIDKLAAIGEERGYDTPCAVFHMNTLRGLLEARFMHRECRKTGELFSGVVIYGSKI